jgi:cytochrome c553
MTTENNARYLWLGLLLGGSLAAFSAGAQEGAAATAVGSIEAGRTKSATCAACHGVDGNSVTPDWPMLAGQHSSYIVRQLRAFKNGERTDVTMKPFADLLSEQDMLDVAAYFEAQRPVPKGADPALVSLGQQIYRGGLPARGVAACIACHGPDGAGNPLAAYPRISAQHAAYTTKQLNAYAAGDRRSDVDVNQMMRNVASLLFEDEIRALASYVQGLD